MVETLLEGISEIIQPDAEYEEIPAANCKCVKPESVKQAVMEDRTHMEGALGGKTPAGRALMD